MHGQYIRSMDRQPISEEDMFLWLSRGDLKGVTESEIIAAQDQAYLLTYSMEQSPSSEPNRFGS